MATALFGLRSGVSSPAGAGVAMRAKLASLLFDCVLFEGGAIEVREDGSARLGRTTRPGVKRLAPDAAAGRLTRVCHFDGVLDDLRVTACSWAGVVVATDRDEPADQAVAVRARSQAQDTWDAWLEHGLVQDLTMAHSLDAVLMPGPSGAQRLIGMPDVRTSDRAIVIPDPSAVPFEDLHRVRAAATMVAARRLLMELVELVRRRSASAAIDTFDAIGEDIEELVWQAIAAETGPPGRAATIRLAVGDSPSTPGGWSALLVETQAL